MNRERDSYGQFATDPTPISIRLLNQRFITSDGCWEWLGTIEAHGYGHICIDGKNHFVHRIMAVLCLGLDDSNPNHQALHKCDNKACFNPDHLYIGTYGDNIQDRFDRDKLGKVAKLTQDEVYEIKDRLAAGERGIDLAKEFNVSRPTISGIKTGKHWFRLKPKDEVVG